MRLRSFLLAALLLGPLPAASQTVAAYRSAATITPGTPVAPGDAVALACSVAGTIRLVMTNNSTLDFYALQGTAIVDNLAVKDVSASATTATCTVAVLYRN
jgi:hypothetical protein